MRILHVITSLRTGGAEHLMVDLLPRLKRGNKNRVDLLLFDGTQTPFMQELKSHGVKIISLSMGGNVYNPLNIFKLVRYMSQYDIIHTHNTACQFYAPIARIISFSRKPLVTTEHSSNNRRRTKWWCKPIDEWMYKRYAAVICIAGQARRNLETYLGRNNNIVTIMNGVDTERFIRSVKDVSGQNEFVITMVAGLRKEKDHETLLKAMTHLPDKYRLQIVGDGERRDALVEFCSQLGLNDRVTFMGVRLDVPDILEQSDVIVLSSHWEGLSLSSIEGMASGRPFIASDVDGLREIVGGAGVLFPHGDDHALAKAIRDLCENPDDYKKVANACQEHAKNYDISNMVDGYNKLYQSLRRFK